MSDIAIGYFDYEGLLAHLTGSERADWKEADGPESRCGLDYWYENAGTGALAWINLDQTFLQVTIDEESVFSQELDELDSDDESGKFFRFDAPPAP